MIYHISKETEFIMTTNIECVNENNAQIVLMNKQFDLKNNERRD